MSGNSPCNADSPEESHKPVESGEMKPGKSPLTGEAVAKIQTKCSADQAEPRLHKSQETNIRMTKAVKYLALSWRSRPWRNGMH